MITALVGGRVVDGTGGKPIPGATVVIEGTRIAEVTRQKHEFGPDVLALDVTGKTVMPGLIDCHQHFATWPTMLASMQAKSLMYHASTTVAFMRQYLHGGCTTARDCGGLEVGWSEAQKEGLIEGPRVKTCIVQIQPTNGMMDWMPGVGGAVTPQGVTLTVPGVPFTWADGPYAVRAKVREVLRYGADFVKAFNTAAPWTGYPRLRADRALFTREELEALVDEAHRAGVPASVHCIGSEEALLEAVLAGADSIEHGIPMTKRIAEEMAARGTWWIPTLQAFEFHSTVNPDPAAHETAVQMWRRDVPATFDIAQAAGVPIAAGTDMAFAADLLGKELKLMTDFGVTPSDAVVAATKNGARCMRMDNLVGTLEAGKEADLLVVNGNPLQDIGILSVVENLLLVMQAGRPCSGVMTRQFPVEFPIYPRFVL